MKLKKHNIDLKPFLKIQTWRSSLWIIAQWLLIIIPIIAIGKLNLPLWGFIPIYIISIMWIGARQHGLAILMHDGAHFRLAKNKILNDVISELFLAWPIFITTREYRESHLKHHHYLNTSGDPDWAMKLLDKRTNHEWQFPNSTKKLKKIFFRDLFGLNTFQVLIFLRNLFITRKGKNKVYNKKPGYLYNFLRISYYLTIISAAFYFNFLTYILLFWMVPLLTWLKLVLRIRSIAEHFAIYDINNPSDKTRTTYPTIFDRMFITAFNICYHAEHHKFPAIPFYHLPKFHRELLKIPGYKQKTHITNGYLNVLRECIK